MKKIIAISVMFALAAGAVFAEINLMGQIGVQVVAAESDTAKGSESTAGSEIKNGHVDATFTNEEGTAGGKLRVYAPGAQGWWGSNRFAFVWWKPVDKFRVQFGHNPDGDWGAAQISGWGLNAAAQDFVAIDSDSDGGKYGNVWKKGRSAGFYGGFSVAGAAISIYPMDALTINIGIPYTQNQGHGGGFDNTYDIYPYTHLNVKYDLEGLGTLRISFQGRGGLEAHGQVDGDERITGGKSIGSLYASFLLTAIEGIGIDFGVGYTLPYDSKKNDVEILGFTSHSSTRETPDIEAALGARYTGDGFAVKARVGATLGGSTKNSYSSNIPGDTTVADANKKSPTQIGVVILPSVTLEAFTLFVNAGLGMSIPDKGPSTTDWYFNPYIRKSVSNLNFYAGIKFGSAGAPIVGGVAGTASTHWAVPFGIDCSF